MPALFARFVLRLTASAGGSMLPAWQFTAGRGRMAIGITPLHPHIGAAVSGLDASRPLDDAALAALWRAIDEHAVLVVHDQHLTDRQLHDFAARFGELEIGRSALRPGRRRLAIPQIGDISNLDEDNRLRARDDRKRLDSLGNRLWHTDASYMKVPVVLGMLFAVTLPPPSPFGAGETEFADMRAAYDALSAELKAAIDDLVVEHDVFWSRGQIGFTEFPPGEREQFPPSHQRLVRRHPGSGRKTLYLSAHASHIVGWPVPEGRLLLADLTAHATQRAFVYSHKWRVGDLVIWDNRDTMHRGRPHDESCPRDLRRATTLDVGSTLDEAA
jgi:alpha-ketoglutarate-dependent 2,4-dichlorophenoxyacetate dioxygenase